jgi:hypothetical protein
VSFGFVCNASCDVAHRLTLAFLEGHEFLKWEDNEWRYLEKVYEAHGEVHLTEPHFIVDQCDCKSGLPDRY